jgi:hypothetical protein
VQKFFMHHIYSTTEKKKFIGESDSDYTIYFSHPGPHLDFCLI